jgi:general stress protein YciG
MAGNKKGGLKLRQTMINKFGSEEAWKEYMRNNGKIGGESSKTGGFYYKKYVLNDIESVKEAGRRGGRASKRTKATA